MAERNLYIPLFLVAVALLVAAIFMPHPILIALFLTLGAVSLVYDVYLMFRQSRTEDPPWRAHESRRNL